MSLIHVMSSPYFLLCSALIHALNINAEDIVHVIKDCTSSTGTYIWDLLPGMHFCRAIYSKIVQINAWIIRIFSSPLL